MLGQALLLIDMSSPASHALAVAFSFNINIAFKFLQGSEAAERLAERARNGHIKLVILPVSLEKSCLGSLGVIFEDDF